MLKRPNLNTPSYSSPDIDIVGITLEFWNNSFFKFFFDIFVKTWYVCKRLDIRVFWGSKVFECGVLINVTPKYLLLRLPKCQNIWFLAKQLPIYPALIKLQFSSLQNNFQHVMWTILERYVKKLFLDVVRVYNANRAAHNRFRTLKIVILISFRYEACEQKYSKLNDMIKNIVLIISNMGYCSIHVWSLL